MAETTVVAEPRFRPKFRARLRFARISARKLRYVADLIRGRDYNSAVSILRSCPKRGAVYCRKVLDSAMENAQFLQRESDRIRRKRELYPVEALRDMDFNHFYVSEIRVDPGPVIKRWRPSSQRRPTMILKRFSHLEIVLQEGEPKVSKQDRAKQKRRAKGGKPAAAAPAAVTPAKPEAKPAPESRAKEPKAEKKRPGKKGKGKEKE